VRFTLNSIMQSPLRSQFIYCLKCYHQKSKLFAHITKSMKFVRCQWETLLDLPLKHRFTFFTQSLEKLNCYSVLTCRILKRNMEKSILFTDKKWDQGRSVCLFVCEYAYSCCQCFCKPKSQHKNILILLRT
jgi:hypothetical protein